MHLNPSGHFQPSDLVVANDKDPGKKQKVIKIYFKDETSAQAFARFAGNAARGSDGSVIFGPERAQKVFEKLHVPTRGRTQPHSMYSALVHDAAQPQSRANATFQASAGLHDGENKKFKSAFDYIRQSDVDAGVQKTLGQVLTTFQQSLSADRTSDKFDMDAHTAIKAIANQGLIDKKTADTMHKHIDEIKREVVQNNRQSIGMKRSS